jgi:hypothetical protein
MIESLMAGARALRGSGWSLSLLGLTCCAAEADVLSEDGLRGIQVIAHQDASAPGATGGGGAADAAWTDQYVPRDSGKGPTWTGCDALDILERGRTGDPCSFVSECYSLVPNCGKRTALCANGVLHTGQVSKNVCTEDDPLVLRRCAAPVPDGCCVELWQCQSSEELLAAQPVVRVCALDCENISPAAASTVVTSCPDDPEGAPWPSFPPALGTPCAGDFVCDSNGRSVGLASEAFTLDDFGRIYWCQHGSVQRAAIGSTLPWNTPVFP